MVTRKPVEDAPSGPETFAIDAHMLAAIFQAWAVNNVFSSRSARKAPTLADYEGSEKWPLWKNLRRHALVDKDTWTRDGTCFYAPDPVPVGGTFQAPLTKFWKDHAELGTIERVE